MVETANAAGIHVVTVVSVNRNIQKKLLTNFLTKFYGMVPPDPATSPLDLSDL